MSENFYETWSPIAKRIAKSVAYDYPDVEAEDLEQDLYVKILSLGWQNPDDQSVVPILRKTAKDQAAKERAEHLIQSPQYSYRTSDVRRILKRVFDDWVSSSSFTNTDDEGAALPNHDHTVDYDDLLVEYSDVKRAWEMTPLHYRKVIFERYALNWEFDSAGERKVQRAVARLTDCLNTYQPRSRHDGPGSRREISNARARFLIDAHWGTGTAPGNYDRW